MSDLQGINTAIQAATNVANTISVAKQNKKDRKFTEKMYEKQKADNIDFWNMQNTYNSPQEQMKRLQQAGLNPNLVYGDGVTGNVASAPDSVQPKEFTQRAPTLDGPSPVDAYFNVQAKQAQVDNMKLQNDLLAQRKLMNDIDYDLPTYGTEWYDMDGNPAESPNKGHRYEKLYNDSKRSGYDALSSEISMRLNKANEKVTVETVLQKLKNLKNEGSKILADTDRINAAKVVLENQAKLQEFEKMLNEAGVDRQSPFFIKYILALLDKQKVINKK